MVGAACWDVAIDSWRSSTMRGSSVRGSLGFGWGLKKEVMAVLMDDSADRVHPRVRSCCWVLESSGVGVV